MCTSPDDIALDPIDMLTELVDASLVRVFDDFDGEPRVTMLETIRSYAAELLDASDEVQQIRERHARHLAELVAVAYDGLASSDSQPARATLLREHADIVSALDWWLGCDAATLEEEASDLALAMAAGLGSHWATSGRLADAIRWLQRAVDWAGDRASPELVRCLACLSNSVRFHGEGERSLELAERALAMMRQFPRPQRGMPYVLRTLSAAVTPFGRLQEGVELLELAVAEARINADMFQLGRSLSELGGVLSNKGDLARSRQVEEEAIDVHERHGDVEALVGARQNFACTLRLSGELAEAEAMMRAVIAPSIAISDESELTSLTDDYAALLAELGHDMLAARLLGAADAGLEREEMDRSEAQALEIGPAIDAARGRLSDQAWAAAYERGRSEPPSAALMSALQATAPPDR